MKIIANFLLFATLFATAAAFVGRTGLEASTSELFAEPVESVMDRKAFVSGVASALIVAPSITFAKTTGKDCECEKEQNTSSCMGLCLYECTKHGGNIKECEKDCARQCKTEKGQRTMATPITEKGVDYN